MLEGESPMSFKFAHNNINVLDLDRSLEFYQKALGLTEVRRKEAEDGSFILSYLGDGVTPHNLELTWVRDPQRPLRPGGQLKSIWLSPPMISTAPTRPIKKWDVSAMRIPKWASISSATRWVLAGNCTGPLIPTLEFSLEFYR